jgi:hypothetical protein
MKEITKKAVQALEKGLGYVGVKATEGDAKPWGQEIKLFAPYETCGTGGIWFGFFVGEDHDDEENARKCVEWLVAAVRRYKSLPEISGGEWWGD